MLDCYKEKQIPAEAKRNAHKHGAKSAKRDISSEYVAICTGIQCNGRAVAETASRAKPSGMKLYKILGTHISEDTLKLADESRS